jgi:hypothetical protein
LDDEEEDDVEAEAAQDRENNQSTGNKEDVVESAVSRREGTYKDVSDVQPTKRRKSLRSSTDSIDSGVSNLTGRRSSCGSEDSTGEKQRAWKVDDFVLGKPLGKGKFGNVYLAKQKRSGCAVALKVLFKAPMQAANCVNALKREVEIQCRLKHKGIVQLFG